MKKRNLKDFLTNKNRSYSAQAAVTSLIVHLVLIIFAGSIVAVRYVQKQNAELIARTESKPKLERKKMQAARIEQIQKKALTSKLVSKKVSIANPEFVLPDTGRISSLKTQKIMLPGADAGRALKNLSRSTGIGPANINFFGVRAESEKVVFAIEASAGMLDDRTGGVATYEYIREELAKIIAEMKTAILFNLVFYDQQRVFMFRPNLVPATKDTANEVVEWMKTVNGNPEEAGLHPDQNNYTTPGFYDTAVGSDAQGWLRALQCAMEQQPDTVLMLGLGWGHHHISQEKTTRLLDAAMWELMIGSVISDAPALLSDRKLKGELLKEADVSLQQEEKLRQAKIIPTGFVRDIAQYVEYSKNQVLEHLESVYQTGYKEKGLSRPDVHFVCLSEPGNQVVSSRVTKNLWALTGRFNGKFEFLSREAERIKTTEAGTQQVAENTDASAGVPMPPISFLGAEGSGTRIAFILEASTNMLSDETGGTFSYELIKERLQKAVAGIQSNAQFNIILYNEKQIALFQPEMVAAELGHTTQLKEWLQSVNKERTTAGIPDTMVSDVSLTDYRTVVGTDSSGWLRAFQVAEEQQADSVFIVGSGWGAHSISRDKGRKLLDFSIWKQWSGGAAAGMAVTEETTEEEGTEEGEVVISTTTTTGSKTSKATITGMKPDGQQRDALLKDALKRIEAENKLRKLKGLPPPFVRDLLSYFCYTAQQVSDHLSTVCTSSGAGNPAINFICLTPGQATDVAGISRNLQKLTEAYGGALILFRGADNLEEIKKLNRDIELSN